MDWNVDALNKILAALSKIETAIQKTKSYRDANIPLLSGQIGEGINLSGTLGLLDTQTALAGLVEGLSEINGLLNSGTGLTGLIEALSGVDISGELDIQTILAGFTEAEASLVATLSAVTRLLDGECISASEIGESVNLDTQSGFVGACESGTVVFASLSGV